MYNIKDGALVYSKGYPTIKEAKQDAERYIKGMMFGELEDITICVESTGEVAATFHADIEWD